MAQICELVELPLRHLQLFKSIGVKQQLKANTQKARPDPLNTCKISCVIRARQAFGSVQVRLGIVSARFDFLTYHIPGLQL
ncbi:hypothetical protein HanRHA438_Chr10g0451051 [Helianthus annuus]|uniref:Uncharacterized protein n=1 Tax=Helianthus annuus TaxID=4232 RepID=A0A251TLJ2_HELAN|nr:hypothetical protein HanXRQr2_Chr10g0439061 [Helianthus annuus]KAJ0513726.1 hypothetical protein HanHA300_Chr10g0361081 [Helianthus annuus]KAJ0521631.1 hypothetical protein HanIR_Chr10g0473191 [Helianthus annuus]KAJ0529830.1 hypothetical protein HanHA89_Chr10g0382521 [Helianthus annuus]KAJ0696704.1 hypothetical protein HanLR1_Chr10g0360271 [Helianthus annuus]